MAGAGTRIGSGWTTTEFGPSLRRSRWDWTPPPLLLQRDYNSQGALCAASGNPLALPGLDEHAASALSSRRLRTIRAAGRVNGFTLRRAREPIAGSLLHGEVHAGCHVCGSQRFIQCLLRLCFPGEELGRTRHLKRSRLIYGSSCCEFTCSGLWSSQWILKTQLIQ